MNLSKQPSVNASTAKARESAALFLCSFEILFYDVRDFYIWLQSAWLTHAVCAPYLTLCVLWLVKDRASCSEASAIWEPYLRTSASFLPRGDMAVLDVCAHTHTMMQLNLQKHTLKRMANGKYGLK